MLYNHNLRINEEHLSRTNGFISSESKGYRSKVRGVFTFHLLVQSMRQRREEVDTKQNKTKSVTTSSCTLTSATI